MEGTIQARYGSINFTELGNLADKEIFTSGNTQVYANSTFRDPSTGKIDTTKVIMVNTVQDNQYDELPIPALLLNWSGATFDINNKTYTINTTPELLEAIRASANHADKLNGTEFYNDYNSLLDRLTYIESLLKPIYYKWYDRTGINIGDENVIYLNEKVTMLPGDGLTDESETFMGWICSLDEKLYQPGETFTLTKELYDLFGDGYNIIQFTAVVETSSYSVGIDVTNGRYTGTSPQTIEYGDHAFWEVYADEGYELPISVTNGTISGNMVTSDKVTNDFTVYVNCVDLSYIEPAYSEYSFWIDGTKVYDNTWIDLGQTITIPAPQDEELGDDKELFEGWICELNGNLYQPGDQYTLTQEDYDKIVGGVFTFNASFKNSYYVGINVTNGRYGGSTTKRIKYGEQASWTVYADDGYKLPTSVTNGTISGNIVTSDIVTNNFTVDVVCEEDIQPGLTDPESSETEPGLTDPE